MFWGFKYTRILLGSLLVLHVLWIGTHLYLVKNHQLNAWKLGGYGMYTRPSPRFRLNAHVEGLEDKEKWQSKPNFSSANWYFVLPCRPISASRIVGFYQDNPEALGKTTHLLITIRTFERYPVKAPYLPKVDLKITWPNANTFVWEGKVCDQTSEGQGQWLP